MHFDENSDSHSNSMLHLPQNHVPIHTMKRGDVSLDWRRRKHGSPRQIGQAFPVEGESAQKKRSTLDKIRGRFSGEHRSQREREYIEKIRNALKSKDEKLLMDDGIITEADAEFLQSKGLITIDPYTEQISLTDDGKAYFFKKQALREKELEKAHKASEGLTALEREWLKTKMDEEEGRT